MKSLKEILEATEAYLHKHGAQSPRPEAEWLICHALKLKRLDLYVQFERPITAAELDIIRPMMRRRATGEPVQYITGNAPFYNDELTVGPGVLVPRPETERLVDIAKARYPGAGAILDICTGSGAIPIALAGELPDSPTLVATELSAEALKFATVNRDTLGYTDRIELLQGDLFKPVNGRTFSLITANPPYVTVQEMAALPKDVREFEPSTALVAGEDGLDIIRRICRDGQTYLDAEGVIVMEIGEKQGKAVRELLAEHGWKEIEVLKDYNHRDRVVVARKG